MNNQCDIIRDLLPLYVDGACSAASSEMIKNHLASCAECRAIYEQMCSHTNEDILTREKESVIIRHERKEGLRVIKYIFIAIAILYAPALLLVSLFSDGDGTFISIPYSFILLVLFVYTVPFYFAFIESGRLICSALDKRRKTAGEMVFNAIGAVLTAGIIILGIVATALDLDNLINPALCLAGILALNWLISAIVYKKKPNLRSTLTDKTFWICVAILLIVIILLVSVTIMFSAKHNLREETIEVGYSIDGYVIDESGLYKFVTIVEGKSLWVDFELTIESNKILN